MRARHVKRHYTRVAHGPIVCRQARTHPRRGQQAIDRVGDRAQAGRRGCRARVHVPGRAHRELGAGAGGERLQPARHGVRCPLGRRRRTGLRRGGEDVRRRPRPARPLGGVRRRRGSRRQVHGHASRPFLDGGRRQRVLARRLRPRGRAADGSARRWLDRHDDLPRWRAGGPALQRHGRGEGDARCVGSLPRVGPRAQVDPGQCDLRRSRSHPRRPVDRRLPHDGVDRRGAVAAPAQHRRGRRRRRRRVFALRRVRRRDGDDALRGLRLYTRWACPRAFGTGG